MSRFKKESGKELKSINTASLPDIVFMLLFFFMVTTVMRETDLKVSVILPEATEIKKLEKKSLVSYIYIGKPHPNLQKTFGSEPRIQLNDTFATPEDIRDFITSEREQMDENDQKQMTVSLKIDQNTKMGIVTEVKQNLRKASALKIMYSSHKKVDESLLR
ncbi:MAG TPA: biopolymer transporter ExbD [Bacteroides sp.]|nr:biopolymer transporter ExbD [Bacteroides sp.]